MSTARYHQTENREPVATNFLTQRYGVRVLYQFQKDQLVDKDASNLLSDDDRKLWLSSQRVPLSQSCLIVDLSQASQMYSSKLLFRSLGFKCWHAYVTNPCQIRVSFSSTDSQPRSFIPWQTVTMKLQAGTQYFDLREKVRACQLRFIKLEILNTYQSQDKVQKGKVPQTYLNQIMMYEASFHSKTVATPVLQLFSGQTPKGLPVFNKFSQLNNYPAELVRFERQGDPDDALEQLESKLNKLGAFVRSQAVLVNQIVKTSKADPQILQVFNGLTTGYEQLSQQINKQQIKIRGVREEERELEVVELPLSQDQQQVREDKNKLAQECILKCQDFIKQQFDQLKLNPVMQPSQVQLKLNSQLNSTESPAAKRYQQTALNMQQQNSSFLQTQNTGEFYLTDSNTNTAGLQSSAQLYKHYIGSRYKDHGQMINKDSSEDLHLQDIELGPSVEIGSAERPFENETRSGGSLTSAGVSQSHSDLSQPPQSLQQHYKSEAKLETVLQSQQYLKHSDVLSNSENKRLSLRKSQSEAIQKQSNDNFKLIERAELLKQQAQDLYEQTEIDKKRKRLLELDAKRQTIELDECSSSSSSVLTIPPLSFKVPLPAFD